MDELSMQVAIQSPDPEPPPSHVQEEGQHTARNSRLVEFDENDRWSTAHLTKARQEALHWSLWQLLGSRRSIRRKRSIITLGCWSTEKNRSSRTVYLVETVY